MRPVDELHSLLRHSRAHNRRETIAFGRRHSDQLLREYVLMVWRNMVKRKTERRSEDKTPAMSLGLARHRWDWGRVFSARLFPSKLTLPEGWMDLYVRGIDTLPLKVNRRHDLKLAF